MNNVSFMKAPGAGLVLECFICEVLGDLVPPILLLSCERPPFPCGLQLMAPNGCSDSSHLIYIPVRGEKGMKSNKVVVF